MILESAVNSYDNEAIVEFLGFKKFKPMYHQSVTGYDEKPKSAISADEALKQWNECVAAAKNKFKQTANYTKAVAAKGNKWVDDKVDSVINAKKHEMLNKLGKGIVKATIIALIVSALVAVIVIPGGGVAAGAASKALI